MLLSTASRECLQHLGAVRGYSPSTLVNYERSHRQFLAFLHSRGLPDDVASFTPDHVMGFMSYLGARGAVGNTILNKLHGLAAMARYLRHRKDHRGRPVLAVDPTHGLDQPSATVPETKFLLPDELAALVSAPAPPELDLVRRVLVDTGLRCSELIEANIGDLKDVAGAVYLTLKVKGRRQAGAQPASIPLSSECAAAVRAAVAARGTVAPRCSLTAPDSAGAGPSSRKPCSGLAGGWV